MQNVSAAFPTEHNTPLQIDSLSSLPSHYRSRSLRTLSTPSGAAEPGAAFGNRAERTRRGVQPGSERRDPRPSVAGRLRCGRSQFNGRTPGPPRGRSRCEAPRRASPSGRAQRRRSPKVTAVPFTAPAASTRRPRRNVPDRRPSPLLPARRPAPPGPGFAVSAPSPPPGAARRARPPRHMARPGAAPHLHEQQHRVPRTLAGGSAIRAALPAARRRPRQRRGHPGSASGCCRQARPRLPPPPAAYFRGARDRFRGEGGAGAAQPRAGREGTTRPAGGGAHGARGEAAPPCGREVAAPEPREVLALRCTGTSPNSDPSPSALRQGSEPGLPRLGERTQTRRGLQPPQDFIQMVLIQKWHKSTSVHPAQHHHIHVGRAQLSPPELQSLIRWIFTLETLSRWR